MEQWKQIEDFNDYEVSTWGNVRNVKTGRIMKQSVNSRGYLKVKLSKNGKQYTKAIHRLVAIAFIPNPHNKPTVNHINEDKHDNRVENLEWATQKEQVHHGTFQQRRTEKIGRKVKCIELDIIYDSLGQAEKETGCKKSNIISCCKGRLESTKGYTWEYVD